MPSVNQRAAMNVCLPADMAELYYRAKNAANRAEDAAKRAEAILAEIERRKKKKKRKS